MKKNDELFNLINSMNTGEKGYFKKFSRIHSNNGENKYLRLFNCISNMKVYDDELIKKEFKGEKLLNQLGVAKHYLHESILNALVNYHKDTDETSQLNHLLAMAEIAFHKADFNKCRSLIEKGKQLAQKHDKHTHLLSFLSNEITLSSKLGVRFAELEKIHEERAHVEKLGHVVAEINLYNARMMSILAECDLKKPGKEQKDKLNALMNHIRTNAAKYQQSFNAAFKYFELCRNYEYLVNHDLEKAFKLSGRSIELFEKHPEKIPAGAWNYITLLLGNTEFYNNNGRYDESLKTSAKIKDAMDLYRKRLGEPSYKLLFAGFVQTRLGALLYSRKYTEAMAHMERYEKNLLEGKDTARPQDIRVFHFYKASLLLLVNQPGMALNVVQQLSPQIDKETNKLMKFLVSMLEILAHYQMNNLSLLPHLLKSLQRWSKTYYNKTSAAFSIFASMVRALSKGGNNSVRLNILIKYNNKFNYYFQSQGSLKPLLEDFIDIRAWIEIQLEKGGNPYKR